jgi:hypothetical protein
VQQKGGSGWFAQGLYFDESKDRYPFKKKQVIYIMEKGEVGQ